jgi:arylsulfate sulfotransferase
MNRLRSGAWFALTGIVLSLASAGCGTGDPYADPSTSIASTQNPLVAQVKVTLPRRGGSAWVEFGTDTTYGRQTSVTTRTTESGQILNVLVAGMRPKTNYHMRTHVDWYGTDSWTDQDRTFTTGPLPSNPFPTLVVTRPNPSLSSTENPGIELVDLIDVTGKTHMIQALFTDRDGHPIWYYDTDVSQGGFPYTMKLLPNGHMLFSVSGYVFGSGFSLLREVDLAGNTIREMSNAQLLQAAQQAGFDLGNLQQFHHDIVPLDNGHLIVLVNAAKQFTDLPGYPGVTNVLGDELVDLDPNWNPVWTWSAFDHLDVNRHLNGLPDWTHGNGLVYLPSDGNLLLSMRHQAWVLKIDYRNGAGSGDVLWRLGNGGDFALSGGDEKQWFYFQHFPALISQTGAQMVLSVWDNGNLRPLPGGGECNQYGIPACYSRATIFDIDESTKVANLQWEDTPGYFGFWGGSENQLENGNVEFDLNAPLIPPYPGVLAEVQEVTQQPSPQIVWKMDIGGANAYRAYRVPSLYPGVQWTY